MKRLCIYAHFDAQGEVKRHVRQCLRELRRDCQRVELLSTAALPPAEVAEAETCCDAVTLKGNAGYDFGMWRHALASRELGEWDELVLVNSSVFGPVFPLGPVFARMTASACDFWGMTDNHEIAWHLQSYFLAFKRRVLGSPAFAEFWSSVLPYRDKAQAIRSYEVGLTVFLQGAGFQPRAFVPSESLVPSGLLGRLYRHRRGNPTCCHPLRLLRRGMPFVKVELLRDNPVRVPLAPVLRALRRAGYDRSLLEFDRPRTTRW
ncbi:MAG: hypothetical protein HY744_08095 [Deltaproteobacteria bacterium]|nr:hypothetical protein [Deltaproteobacteria bacterium]